MEKLAENDLTYFYLRHVIVVTAVTTISLTPVVLVGHKKYKGSHKYLILSYLIKKGFWNTVVPPLIRPDLRCTEIVKCMY